MATPTFPTRSTLYKNPTRKNTYKPTDNGPARMKLLTLNFLTCAIKTCKTNPASFPLHPRDAELEIVEADVNLPFLKNILPRLMWEQLRAICLELGLPQLPETPPTPADLVEPSATAATALDTPDTQAQAGQTDEELSQTGKDLHRILLETCIQEGKLVCGACEHEYAVKEGVANFLLPGHLV
ncbi:Multifunctional methyltransferase subunit trm112 [Pyrenophora seminiperda CCB06]|uniref:Multifunctional methyltransferase subunit trm112 n=1 Tax=Pyrenophora seminiperda CCB06 TaxID=1302712 RepID=A0A3M7MHM8_9PLEO|nr:Multifunctional methyltransferase subunit trm112 [Pyrenophora seminiperda CCB06]